MLLTVKALQGRECSLQVSPEERVGALKALVAERLQVPVEQQRLLYRGKALAALRALIGRSGEPGSRAGQRRRPPRSRRSGMRVAGPLRLLALGGVAALAWLAVTSLLGPPRAPPPLLRLLRRDEGPSTPAPRPPRFKCGLPRPCPPQHFAFRVLSGAANVVGPRICLEGRELMSSVKNNVGRGLNIALVNGVSGELIAAQAFDMWAGDVEELLRFLRPLHEGTLVLVASYDDPATKLTEESRRLFGELGSAVAKDLGFRDSWVFVGAKGVQDTSPFEQHVRNSRGSNKYEGWPEALELGGCVPRRPPG